MQKTKLKNEEINLIGSGKIVIIMVINLGRFMAEEDDVSRDIFRNIRGTEQYTSFLRNLSFTRLFTRLENKLIGSDPWIEIQGIETGVFQKHLVEKGFPFGSHK